MAKSSSGKIQTLEKGLYLHLATGSWASHSGPQRCPRGHRRLKVKGVDFRFEMESVEVPAQTFTTRVNGLV